MTQPLPESLSDRDSISAWLCDPLPPDVTRSLKRLSRTERVHRVAVMPGVHLSGDVGRGST